ncbi:MAG TPA: rhodanese-like domain-containing protein [Solirubrobacteraceae bacterium]|nr:rhodanese-like domain-containing protein [Solirubrobacteraceae bacterium]
MSSLRAGPAFLEVGVFFRQLLNDETACASYLFGCTTHPNFAVVEPHIDLVDEYIALAGREALSLWLALRDASVARLAEVERAARDYLGAEVDTIGREELLARMRAGEVVLVDVRPREEFDAGHIEGARSIPLAELEQRLAELPADREIVAYCRGPFCAYAHQAVRMLNTAGRQAQRLREGWPEWQLARQRVARLTPRAAGGAPRA